MPRDSTKKLASAIVNKVDLNISEVDYQVLRSNIDRV